MSSCLGWEAVKNVLSEEGEQEAGEPERTLVEKLGITRTLYLTTLKLDSSEPSS